MIPYSRWPQRSINSLSGIFFTNRSVLFDRVQVVSEFHSTEQKSKDWKFGKVVRRSGLVDGQAIPC